MDVDKNMNKRRYGGWFVTPNRRSQTAAVPNRRTGKYSRCTDINRQNRSYSRVTTIRVVQLFISSRVSSFYFRRRRLPRGRRRRRRRDNLRRPDANRRPPPITVVAGNDDDYDDDGDGVRRCFLNRVPRRSFSWVECFFLRSRKLHDVRTVSTSYSIDIIVTLGEITFVVDNSHP